MENPEKQTPTETPPLEVVWVWVSPTNPLPRYRPPRPPHSGNSVRFGEKPAGGFVRSKRRGWFSFGLEKKGLVYILMFFFENYYRFWTLQSICICFLVVVKMFFGQNETGPKSLRNLDFCRYRSDQNQPTKKETNYNLGCCSKIIGREGIKTVVHPHLASLAKRNKYSMAKAANFVQKTPKILGHFWHWFTLVYSWSIMDAEEFSPGFSSTNDIHHLAGPGPGVGFKQTQGKL